jgi:hypothetical protein
MLMTQIPKRPLKNVSDDIWNAIFVMEQRYGAVLTHDSGHDQKSNEKATTWIFNFPDFGDAQIAIPMNREKFSLLMRAKTLDGRQLNGLAGDLAVVTQTYVDPKKGVASSLLGPRALFLNPSPGNALLRVVPNPGSVDALLALYLGRAGLGGEFRTAVSPSPLLESVSGDSVKRHRQPITAEELQRQLDRNAETGKAGELIAVLDELERLQICGCPEPAKFVERVAISDVGRGYDIASTWSGEERCIEVKSTTRGGSDFFLTENESQVLAALGEKAWLYRVVIDGDGKGVVTARLQDPMNVICPEQMVPVVWRVGGDALIAAEAKADLS